MVDESRKDISCTMRAGEAVSAGERVAVDAELNSVSMGLNSDIIDYIFGHMLHQFFVHQCLQIISL